MKLHPSWCMLPTLQVSRLASAHPPHPGGALLSNNSFQAPSQPT